VENLSAEYVEEPEATIERKVVFVNKVLIFTDTVRIDHIQKLLLLTVVTGDCIYEQT